MTAEPDKREIFKKIIFDVGALISVGPSFSARSTQSLMSPLLICLSFANFIKYWEPNSSEIAISMHSTRKSF